MDNTGNNKFTIANQILRLNLGVEIIISLHHYEDCKVDLWCLPMKEFKTKDVVKHVNFNFDWKVIDSTKEWVKVERQNEDGQRIVEEFAPEYLELLSRKSGGYVMGLKPEDFR